MPLGRVQAFCNEMARHVRGLQDRHLIRPSVGRALSVGIEDLENTIEVAFQAPLDNARQLVIGNKMRLLAATFDALEQKSLIDSPALQRAAHHMIGRLWPGWKITMLLVPHGPFTRAGISPRIYAGATGKEVGVVVVDGNPSILQDQRTGPLLIHELSHLLPHVRCLEESGRLERRQTAEFLCDSNGLGYSGPAFARAFAHYLTALGPAGLLQVDGRSHPTTGERHDYLDNLVPTVWGEAWIGKWVRACLGAAPERPAPHRSVAFNLAADFMARAHPHRHDCFDKLKIESPLLSQIKQGQPALHPYAGAISDARNCLPR